jgi:hypothetical protein
MIWRTSLNVRRQQQLFANQMLWNFDILFPNSEPHQDKKRRSKVLKPSIDAGLLYPLIVSSGLAPSARYSGSSSRVAKVQIILPCIVPLNART